MHFKGVLQYFAETVSVLTFFCNDVVKNENFHVETGEKLKCLLFQLPVEVRCRFSFLLAGDLEDDLGSSEMTLLSIQFPGAHFDAMVDIDLTVIPIAIARDGPEPNFILEPAVIFRRP